MTKQKSPADFLRSIHPDQLAATKKAIDKHLAERSLYQFVRQAWSSIETAPFVDSWAVEALCVHLEAVTRGEIRFLLVNFPPRCAKTLVTAVFWPVWTWIQKEISHTSGPQVGILGASYGQDLSLKSSDKMRDLISSPWFQEHWGDTIKIKAGSDTKSDFANTKGGYRQATSITGRLLGYGGSVIIVDDPHNTEDVESEAERDAVLRGWREISATRLNDPKHSAIVVIMQRLNEADVSGEIIGGKTRREWVHLMIPMRHDINRHCVTYIPGDDEPFWEDPREEDGELMWPERFGDKEVSDMEIDLGPYMASGRLQQSPTPAGGGILKREYWQVWEGPLDAAGKEQFPQLEYVAAYLDTAFTQKEENDYCALTVWGLWQKDNVPKLIILHGWKKHLTLHGPPFDEADHPGWFQMTKAERDTILRRHWGVCEWANHTCERFKVDTLLIENKANGIDVANEFRRLYRNAQFSVQLNDPGRKDKVARAHAVVPMFADRMIYAPDRDWAEMVMSECERFPKGAHDDVVDTVTGALVFFRNSGMAVRREEQVYEDNMARQYRPTPKKLYPV